MAERPVVQPPLDRYVVLDYLAEGGMGAIYLGKKLGAGGFEKEVVLKQLLPEFTSQPEFIDLFLREARLSATLDHANIVHTIDLVNAGDEYFIVMEYVRGGDLRTLLKRAKRRKKRLLPQAGIFVAREVLSALAYAHAKVSTDGKPLGLIHRDVSPSNVLVSGTGEVKLTDFGIAKASTHRSIFYRVKGKVGYMSPEQARNETLDSRSDLYSLAVCLYEMLTGERLFVNVGITTSAEEMYKQAVPAVSKKRPGLPKDLDKVMWKALAVPREERYQTAGELQEALLRVAHRNGLMMTASELSEHLVGACGRVTEWATATVKEQPREGTEAYSFGGEPGTGKLGLADIGVDGGPGTGTALLPPDSDSSDDNAPDAPEPDSDLEDYAELGSRDVVEATSDESDISDVDGDWARDVRKRRATSSGMASRLQGLELTSIIQMAEITHAGAKPLVDLSGPGPKAPPTRPPLPAAPVLPSASAAPAPRPARESKAPPPASPKAPPAPAPRSAPRASSGPAPTGAVPTGKQRATSAPVPTARVERVPAASDDPWARRIPPWVPIAGLVVLGIVIAYAIAVSGPDLKPSPMPSGAPAPAPPAPPPPGARGKLTIASDPPGATVVVDGRERCATPCTIDDLPAGAPALVRLTKPGYLPWSGLAAPGAAAERRARLRPVPAPGKSATVSLRGDVPAEVQVNGKDIGHVTTAGPLELPPGKVELTLVAASGATKTIALELKAGDSIEREVQWK
jgi:serine/threonine protein kinase